MIGSSIGCLYKEEISAKKQQKNNETKQKDGELD